MRLYYIYFGFLLFVSCSSKHFKNDNYSSEVFYNKKIVVLSVDPKNINITEPDHFMDDFGIEILNSDSRVKTKNKKMTAKQKRFVLKQKEMFLAKHLDSLIRKRATRRKTEIILDTLKRKRRYTFHFEDLESQTKDYSGAFAYDLPKQTRKDKEEYVLFLDKIFFGFEYNRVVNAPKNFGEAYGSNGTSTHRKFSCEIRYILWDYSKNEYIAYGMASGTNIANWIVNKSDWYNIMDEAIREIFKQIPVD